MNRRLIPALTLTLAACVGLAGCGQATEAPEATAAPDPVPTSGPPSGVSGPSAPSLAQWPAVGCGSRAVVSIDHGRMPTGFRTPEEAVRNSPAVGLPQGVLTLAPAPDSGKGPAQVWVVDPRTDEIQAQVSVFRGPDGWFVDGVMICS